MTDVEPREPVPPYVSFATLLNQLDRMAKEGVPGRVDSSYLVGMAGGTQAQFKQALRSLGLIEDDDRSHPRLTELVEATDKRPVLVADILRSQYPRLVALDQNATRGQLDEALATYGLGTDTRRKAATFFIAAATYAGLPLSSHLHSGRRAASGGTVRRRPRVVKKPPAEPAGMAAQAPASGHTTDVQLGEAGLVTLVVKVNPLALSRDDRAFLFDLIDKFEDRRAAQPATPPGSLNATNTELEVSAS